MRGQVMKKMISPKFIKSPNLLLEEDDVKTVTNEIIKGELDVFLALKKVSSGDYIYELLPEDDLQALLLAAAKLAMESAPHTQVSCSIYDPNQNLLSTHSIDNYFINQSFINPSR